MAHTYCYCRRGTLQSILGHHRLSFKLLDTKPVLRRPRRHQDYQDPIKLSYLQKTSSIHFALSATRRQWMISYFRAEDHHHVPGGINVHLKRRSRWLGFSRLAPTSTPSRASACKLIIRSTQATCTYSSLHPTCKMHDDQLASYWEA